MNDLLNNDHLQDMFTIDDYTKSEEIPGYDITYIKRGDLLTIGIKQNNPVDRFKEYIDSLDDEIFDKVCNEYEEYTGQSLNDLSIKMKNKSLTEDEKNNDYRYRSMENVRFYKGTYGNGKMVRSLPSGV